MVREKLGKAVSPAQNRFINLNRKLALNAIMLRTFLGSVFFMVSLGIFTTLLKRGDDLVKFLVVLYGCALLIFFAYNIIAYLINITKVATSKATNFPVVLFLNTFLGFISQLFFFNLSLAIVVRTLAYMRDSSALICEVKCSIVSYYYNTQVFSQINSLIWWVSLATVVAFIVGNYLVWAKNSK